MRNFPAKAVILDPCCGTGSFIIAAISLNLKNIYGADLDKSAVKMCKKFTRINNIKVLDTLSLTGEDVYRRNLQGI